MKNKVYAAMSTAMPDSALAGTMHKKMRPSGEPQGREISTNDPSREEGEEINRTAGGTDEDFESHEDHIHTKE